MGSRTRSLGAAQQRRAAAFLGLCGGVEHTAPRAGIGARRPGLRPRGGLARLSRHGRAQPLCRGTGVRLGQRLRAHHYLPRILIPSLPIAAAYIASHVHDIKPSNAIVANGHPPQPLLGFPAQTLKKSIVSRRTLVSTAAPSLRGDLPGVGESADEPARGRAGMMSVSILVVDDEPDVADLFRQREMRVNPAASVPRGIMARRAAARIWQESVEFQEKAGTSRTPPCYSSGPV